MYFFHYTGSKGYKGITSVKGKYAFRCDQPQKGQSKQHGPGFYITRLAPIELNNKLPKIGIVTCKTQYVFIFDIPLKKGKREEGIWIGGYPNTEKFLVRNSRNDKTENIKNLYKYLDRHNPYMEISAARESNEEWNEKLKGQPMTKQVMMGKGISICDVIKGGNK